MKLDKQTIFTLGWKSLIVACILAGYWLAVQPPSQKQDLGELGQPIESRPPEVITKKIVWRYSVVDGGVHSEADIEAARANDPIVDEHYRYTPRPDRLVLIQAMAKGYLSYRKGDQIYWTKNQVEFTDWVWAGDVGGEFRPVIRARCGNRVSDVPMLPVEDKQPDLDVLELDGLMALADLPAINLLDGLPMVTELQTKDAQDQQTPIYQSDLGQTLSRAPAILPLEWLPIDNSVPLMPWGGVVILPAMGAGGPIASFGPVPEPGTWMVGIAFVVGAIGAKKNTRRNQG